MYSLICRVAHKRTSMMLWDTNVEAKKSEPVTGSQKLIYCFSKGWLDEKSTDIHAGDSISIFERDKGYIRNHFARLAKLNVSKLSKYSFS